MHRLLLVPLLAVTLATAAVAHPAGSPAAPEMVHARTAEKTLLGAYGSMALGIGAPILLGSALAQTGGDILGIWLMVGGILVGPSTGQFYAQSYGTGMAAAGLRTTGVGLLVVGAMISFADPNPVGTAFALAAFGAFGAGCVYSLVDTHRAVKRYNDLRQAEVFGLTPTLTPTDDGRLRPGAMAWMRF